MKRLNAVIVIIVLMVIHGCSPSPQKEDFVGEWTADNGGIVYLNKNSSCVVENINISKVYPEYKENLNFEGTWEFRDHDSNNNKQYNVFIVSKHTTESIDSIFVFEFDVAGQGILGNKPPWKLYMYIGDPDDMNWYELKKK